MARVKEAGMDTYPSSQRPALTHGQRWPALEAPMEQTAFAQDLVRFTDGGGCPYVAWECKDDARMAPAPTTLPTTLMVLNIPAATTGEDLAHEWGLDGSWDFLYVPMYSGGKRALGYAFINFVSEAASAAFYSQWQGRYLPKFQRGRPLNIVVAEMQGFSANLTHVKQKSAGRLRSRRCRPIIIRDGQRVDMDDV